MSATTAVKLDANAQPPYHLRVLFKKWQRSHASDYEGNPEILDSLVLATDCRVKRHNLEPEDVLRLSQAFERFAQQNPVDFASFPLAYFEVEKLPGAHVTLLKVVVKISDYEKLLFRDLGHPDHQTNLHLHYDVHEQIAQSTSCQTGRSLPSFFSLDPHLAIQPKNPGVHKSLSMKQILEKKLRWVTFGGQYDWTNKRYPKGQPPPFPSDVADVIRSAFPDIEPQAAILNLYSPGDTLSIHRDVSEDCDRSLVSVSIGCDALFFVANKDGSQTSIIRLRSGDAILMSGESRYAWHAVPKVLAGTCDGRLQDWPALDNTSDSYPQWRGWLRNKRINLNIRQMSMENFKYENDKKG